MDDLIPATVYAAVFYHFILGVVLLTLFHSLVFELADEANRNFIRFMSWFLLFFVTLYMGLRPIHIAFGDMGAYYNWFRDIQKGKEVIVKQEYVFNYFLIFCAQFMNSKMFFLLVDIIYIVPMFLFARKYGGQYHYYILLIFMASFSFWTYGTNGIRNGMATSLFLLALVYYDRKLIMYALMALAFGVHNSLMIPIAGFLVAAQWKDPRVYLFVWLLAIPLSLMFGGMWETVFTSLGFGEERVQGYFHGEVTEGTTFRYSGFRWDFLFYSGFAVFAGWYFIFKKDIHEVFYTHLFGTYVVANAFWILVIRTNFSNRFSYLSWFLMGAVIAYPMLKYKIWNDQNKILGTVIFLYFMFTYLLFLRM